MTTRCLLRAAEARHQAHVGEPPRVGERCPLPEVLPSLVGDAPCMRRMAALVRRLACIDFPVLVRGESGSGKELVARALHQCGRRAPEPFVAINGATVGAELGASALFGHARGAFTGASHARLGAFRRAHRGTLFIDEVGALPAEAQTVLLRAVEEGSVLPIGADCPVEVDVRVVVATCEPLEKMVEAGKFRGDLYQRLSACIVHVPPLRERTEDLPHLVRHLLVSLRLGVSGVEPQALSLLGRQLFVGNVRELRNLLTQAALVASEPTLRAADVASALRARWSQADCPMATVDAVRLLEEADGNISRAARLACAPRSTFRDWLTKARQQSGPLGG